MIYHMHQIMEEYRYKKHKEDISNYLSLLQKSLAFDFAEIIASSTVSIPTIFFASFARNNEIVPIPQ